MEKVGERLMEERKRLEKTVAGMAEECRVSKQAQINFEKGRQLPGGAYLIAVAALGGDVSYILTGQRNPALDDPAPRYTPPKYTPPPDEERLLDAYRHSSAEVKAVIKAASLAAAKAARGTIPASIRSKAS